LVRLTLTGVTVVLSLIAAAPALSDVDMEAPPALADVNIRFPDPLFLGASMDGQIRGRTAGRYQAEARLRIGKRVVFREPIEGKLRPRWSRLRVSLDVHARQTVRREARRAHRRPVLAIQVKYYLKGKKHFHLRLSEFIISSRSCRFCTSVKPLLGDTETVFVVHGWGWYPGRSIDAHYGAYCAPGQTCPAIGFVTRFRASRHGRFIFRFRNGPNPLVGVPQPAASGNGPIRFEQTAPGRTRKVSRTVRLRVRYPSETAPL
jgi:hypothetical protein